MSILPLKMSRVKPFGGFTLIEVLVALMFLGILVPALIEGISIANRASELAERGARANELASNKLAELTVDNNWMNGAAAAGDFSPNWEGYRWQSTQIPWEMDDMTKLGVEVFFNVQGQERSVRLTTLVASSTNAQTSGSTMLTGNQLKAGASQNGGGGTR